MRSDQPLLPSNPPIISSLPVEADNLVDRTGFIEKIGNPRVGGPGSSSLRDKAIPNYRNRRETDTETLLTYTKGFLVCAYFVFIIGSGITIKELFTFLFSDYHDLEWVTGIIILILIGLSVLGIYGAFKEDSCILLAYGCIILTVFFLHIALLLVLKNACTNKRDVCSQNMATPPGLAPIIVAISELAIALSAFFMTLVIESEKKKQSVPRLYQVNDNSCQSV